MEWDLKPKWNGMFDGERAEVEARIKVSINELIAALSEKNIYELWNRLYNQSFEIREISDIVGRVCDLAD